mgnify:CR=1 FL=1
MNLIFWKKVSFITSQDTEIENKNNKKLTDKNLNTQ